MCFLLYRYVIRTKWFNLKKVGTLSSRKQLFYSVWFTQFTHTQFNYVSIKAILVDFQIIIVFTFVSCSKFYGTSVCADNFYVE